MTEGAFSPIAENVASCARRLRYDGVAALGELYDISGSRLIRYAEALTRNREDAEDAVQAALVRVARNPQSLAAARHPWAYFLKMVRNESLKIIGRKKPLTALSKDLPLRPAESEPLEEDETRRMVRKALDRLPPEQAEVVVLKIWEEMTFLEISLVLGESANTAASRYRYALEKLSRTLRPVIAEIPR